MSQRHRLFSSHVYQGTVVCTAFPNNFFTGICHTGQDCQQGAGQKEGNTLILDMNWMFLDRSFKI